MNINLRQECNNIKSAPFLYISSLIAMGFILWFIINSIYEVRLSNAISDISSLEKQIMIYKDKKYIVGETKYSKLNNEQLLIESQKNLKQLQSIYLSYQSSSDALNLKRNITITEHRRMSNQISRNLLNQYMFNFKSHTILLREQLLLRLPKEVSKQSEFSDYEYTTNALSFKHLIDDFQILVQNFDGSF